MFAFWQDNRRQLPLGFPAVGLLKSARGLLKETTYDFVLTIIILTLFYLLLLNSGLQQELSTFLWAYRLLRVMLVRADWWVQQSNTECDHRYDCRISDLIASMVHFDRFCRSALSFWFDCNYLHKGKCIYQWLLIEEVVLCHCWSYLLICIVIDHDVNIASK